MRLRPTFIQTDLGNSPCNRNGIKQSGKKKKLSQNVASFKNTEGFVQDTGI